MRHLFLASYQSTVWGIYTTSFGPFKTIVSDGKCLKIRVLLGFSMVRSPQLNSTALLWSCEHKVGLRGATIIPNRSVGIERVGSLRDNLRAERWETSVSHHLFIRKCWVAGTLKGATSTTQADHFALHVHLWLSDYLHVFLFLWMNELTKMHSLFIGNSAP
jgi:hypothetical protein